LDDGQESAKQPGRLVEMGLSSHVASVANTMLTPLGLKLARKGYGANAAGSLAAEQKPGRKVKLPTAAKAYCRKDNPRLLELQQRYKAFDQNNNSHSVWSEEQFAAGVDLQHFRDDCMYVYQDLDGNTDINYLLTGFYLLSQDSRGLFARLPEDDLFGARVFEMDNGMPVSRDLLDSLTEIHFLQRHLSILDQPSFKLLDIGAGYGRLATRMAQAMPNLERAVCADGIAASTFLAEYYLGFRKVNDKASAVPIDELEATLAETRFDVATNIHSFSECTLDTIHWWMALLKRHRVPYLMVAPNADWHQGKQLLSTERNADRGDFGKVITSYGYTLVANDPKYMATGAQHFGVSPTRHYLFKLDH